MHSGYSTTHNIALDHLDFTYISQCSDVKELEKILKILKSKEEGIYPDLEHHCEERLASICPNSRLLRKETGLAGRADLGADEWKSLNTDMNTWTQEISGLDSTLKTQQSPRVADDAVPVRKSQTYGEVRSENGDEPELSNTKNKRVKPRTYDEWDKFNVDEELEKIDGKQEAVTPSNKDQSRMSCIDDLVSAVSDVDMTEEEKSIRGAREKDKGNEAFRSGDFEESVVYYSRSINLQSSIHAYNNRALSYLKLNKWKSAIKDCKHVLKQEPDNVKALMRCGSAYKGKKDWRRATTDFTHVLSLEPSNKKAKDLLEEIENEKNKTEPPPPAPQVKGHRMVIEEVEGDESEVVVSANQTGDNISRTNETNEKLDVNKNDSPVVDNRKTVTNENTATTSERDDILANQNSRVCDDVIKGKGEMATAGDKMAAGGEMAGASSNLNTGGKNKDKNNAKIVENGCDEIHGDERVETMNKINSLLSAEGERGGDRKIVENGNNETEETENDMNERLEKIMEIKKSRESNAAEVLGSENKVLGSENKVLGCENKGTRLCDQSVMDTTCVASGDECNKTNATKDISRDDASSLLGERGGEGGNPGLSRPVFYRRPLRPDIAKDKEAGNALFKSGQYAEALDKYNVSINKLLRETNVEVNLSTLLINRATCFLKIGDTAAAVRDCTSALEAVPHSVKALLRRATAYEQLERYGDAMRDFKHIQILDANATMAFQGSNRCFSAIKELFGLKWQEKLKPAPIVQYHEVPLILDAPSESESSSKAGEGRTRGDGGKSGHVVQEANDGEIERVAGGENKAGEKKGKVDEKKGKVEEKKGKMEDKKDKVGEKKDKVDEKKHKAEEKKHKIEEKKHKVEEKKDKVEEKKDKLEEKKNKVEEKKDKVEDKKDKQTKGRLMEKKEEKAEGIRRDKVELTCEEQFERWKLEGNTHVKKGLFEAAITCYTKCVDTLPGRAVSYTNRALCYLKILKHAEAEKDCSKALIIEPENVKALFRRAQARKFTQNYKDSLTDLTRLLKLDPLNSPAKKEMEETKVLWRKQLEELKKSPKKPVTKPQSRRLNIEEVDDEGDGDRERGDRERGEKAAADKVNKPAPQPQKKSTPVPVPTTVPVLDKISPYEFMNAWNSLKKVKGTQLHAKLLRQVSPEHLPKVFTNKLDGDILTKIIKCLSDHVMPEGDLDLTYLLLHSLTKVQRFNTVSRFLSKHEKLVMEEILVKLRSYQSAVYNNDDISSLQKQFSL